MGLTIYRRSIIAASKAQVSCDLAGESAISGMYYGLNAVGARIWALIQEPRTVQEVYDALLEEYVVEPEHCERELLALLHVLTAKGLIEIKSETVA